RLRLSSHAYKNRCSVTGWPKTDSSAWPMQQLQSYRSQKTEDFYMRVTAIGIGYLGLPHAVCMADLGHQVLAIDVDEEKVAKAARGETPFFEPGLEPLLRKNLD